MYDENNIPGGLPEEIDYTPKAQKNEGPTGVSAPVLDDFGYVAPSSKKDGPTGVSAPVLDDMSSYGQGKEKKGAPTGVSAPVLDDAAAAYTHEKKILTDDDIINGLDAELRERFDALPADKQRQIIDMRRTQLGAVAPPVEVTAPVLDEDIYTPPPKKEEPKAPAEPLTAPILDDEPEPPKYQPKYVDEDLERAKAEAAKKAVSSQLVSEQKDPKESLRMMLELKEQARQESAAKGFKVTIVIALLGLVAAVTFFLLYTGKLGLEYKNGLEGFSSFIENSAVYIAAAVGFLCLLLIAGIGAFKSLATLGLLLFGIIQLFPGLVMVPQHKGSLALAGVLYAVTLGCTVVCFFLLCGSEAVGNYFNRNKDINARHS
ncbi:MAG: ABC transporter permease [Ruminococcus sp.]|nr:ABC transporter permease [Ruminococcus sp.]